jgi:hypothetical protein
MLAEDFTHTSIGTSQSLRQVDFDTEKQGETPRKERGA